MMFITYTACDVGMVDERDQLVVWPGFEVAVAFTEIDVDVHFRLDGGHGVAMLWLVRE